MWLDWSQCSRKEVHCSKVTNDLSRNFYNFNIRDILTVSHKGDSKKHMLHKLVMATNNTTADFEVVGEGGVSSGGETKTMLQDEEGAYIIEANPDYFVHLLDYLRTGELLFDATPANVKIVQAEARYFGLNGLASRCKELLLHLI